MFNEIVSKTKWGRSFTISGLNNPSKLFLLEELQKAGKKILFVSSSEQTALKFYNDLGKLGVSANVFPNKETSFYEEVPSNPYIYREQLKLLIEKPDFIITSVRSLSEKFATNDFIEKKSLLIKKSADYDMDELVKNLVALGYKRTTMVSDAGEFSKRGDIIDIYTLDKSPLRVEFWGDNVVDIRYFMGENQKSYEKVESAKIYPLYKFIVNDQLLNKFTDEVKKIKGEEVLEITRDSIVEKVQNNTYFEGIEYFESFFNPDLIDLFEAFKEYVFIFDDFSEIDSKFELNDKNFKAEYQEGLNSQLKLPLKTLNHLTFDDYSNSLKRIQKIKLDNFIIDEEELIEFESSGVKIFSSDAQEIASYVIAMQKKAYAVHVATDYPKRVQEILKEFEISDCNITYSPNFSLGGGVIEDIKKVVISDKELFNKRSKDVVKGKVSLYKESRDFIENINDIVEGEYVVHSVHGVGKYIGLSKQELDNEIKDYLSIEFANNDKLYMPAEQVNLLVRYRGSANLKPKLSKMGGDAWKSTKERIKKEVEAIARDLLRLYAKRKISEGIAYDPDTVWQYEMEEAFEFTETPDQMKAIIDTKKDMEDTKPMDRLVCADVGFGKTEIAIRAVFKAVMSGKQAVIIVPTTILAMQHFQTISERFKPYPIKVELLSRFRSAKEQKNTVKELINGECDVVIGTHRLLQDDIKFKNLGLLVIDEEHRFGVRHKEKLKAFKQNIDILSMSATPIPRTLYMSLSGIKDMSLINTAPANRLPVKTYVGEYNEGYLKNSINHELAREGQVYILYNRVETIYEFAASLKKIVPEARIAIGHGQMPQKELEDVMLNFSQGNFDILLSTTIIESGLDIANANTMIIIDSDKFGLAQLYQLRGRVGRSQRQAYCYCFYKKGKLLSQEAKSRLNAIKDFTSLGSGYQIALRDIEIRGVGNLLGAKQHGHMINVGFDTYCDLLEECVNEIKGETVEHTEPAIVDINVTAYIPDEWVGSKEQKMIEYKRLSDVKSVDELETIRTEFKDRFSKLPQSVENLIKLIRIRLSATEAKITVIRENEDFLRIYTPYQMNEWLMVRKVLPANITKYINWTIAPKSCKDGRSILSVKKSGLNFEEMFNILTDLFYYMSKVSHEYLIAIKE